MKIQPYRITHQMMPLQKSTTPFKNPAKSEASPMKLNKASDVESLEGKEAKMKKAAEGFEAIFVRQLLSTMRSSLSEGGMFGNSADGEIFADMVDNALAEVMSKKSMLGLADKMYQDMSKALGSVQK